MLIRIKNHIFSLRERVELLILYGVIMFVLGMGLNHLFTQKQAYEPVLQAGPYMGAGEVGGPSPVVDVDTSGLPSALPGDVNKKITPASQKTYERPEGDQGAALPKEPVAPTAKEEVVLVAPQKQVEVVKKPEIKIDVTEKELLKQIEQQVTSTKELKPADAKAYYVKDQVKGVVVPAPHKPLTYASRMVPLSKPLDDPKEKLWRDNIKQGYEDIAQQLVSSKKIDEQMQAGQGDVKVASVKEVPSPAKLNDIAPAVGTTVGIPVPAQHQLSALSVPTKGAYPSKNGRASNAPFKTNGGVVSKKMKVKRGDSISKILNKNGIGNKESYDVAKALESVYDIRKLRVGDELTLYTNSQAPTFNGLHIHGNVTEYIVWRDEIGKLYAKEHEKKVRRKMKHAAGTIKSNLSLLASSLNVPKSITAKVINLYSYQVDFSRDIQSGALFEVVYDEVYNDKGEYVSAGNLLYASIDVMGSPMKIYRYDAADGYKGYYDERGRSIRKSLTRTPINGATISSHFGYRKHPIYKRRILHKGTDFAAPRGTPIFAAGDGVVEFVGRNGGYGKYLKIKHNAEYKTAYAHLHRFAKGVRKGKRVKQGQVVAYVGSTGASTGPHLHYEIIKGGKHKNPMTVKLNPGKRLKGGDLAKFNSMKTQYDALLARVLGERKTRVATVVSE